MNSDEIIIGTDLGPMITIVAMVCKEINITFLKKYNKKFWLNRFSRYFIFRLNMCIYDHCCNIETKSSTVFEKNEIEIKLMIS